MKRNINSFYMLMICFIAVFTHCADPSRLRPSIPIPDFNPSQLARFNAILNIARAIDNNELDAVKEFFNQHASELVQEDKDVFLIRAVMKAFEKNKAVEKNNENYLPMVQFFVGKGANPRAPDRYGRTALHCATIYANQSGNYEILNVLDPARLFPSVDFRCKDIR